MRALTSSDKADSDVQSSKVLTGLITARMAEVQALGTAHQLLQGLKARIGLPTHNSLGSMSARAVKFYTAAVKLTGAPASLAHILARD